MGGTRATWCFGRSCSVADGINGDRDRTWCKERERGAMHDTWLFIPRGSQASPRRTHRLMQVTCRSVPTQLAALSLPGSRSSAANLPRHAVCEVALELCRRLAAPQGAGPATISFIAASRWCASSAYPRRTSEFGCARALRHSGPTRVTSAHLRSLFTLVSIWNVRDPRHPRDFRGAGRLEFTSRAHGMANCYIPRHGAVK